MNRVIFAALLLVSTLPSRVALGIGYGRAQGTGAPALSRGGGAFDGKDYELGLYLTPMFGYESNYKVTTVEVAGSAVWALEGGAELRYRPSDRLKLRTELSAMVRSPVSETRLLEMIAELPAQLLYRLSDRLELNLASQLLIERSKTPPVFLEGAAGTTIRYGAVAEILRGALAYHLSDWLFIEAGPYFQIKQVNFLENPPDSEPDYRFFDLGGDVALKLQLADRLAVRLRYDLAHRQFTNYAARPPEHAPALGEELSMVRHLWGISTSAKVFGPLRLRAGYNLRLNRDNGGFFNYVDNIIRGGLAFDWRERVSLEASLTYLRRSYGDRTPCEASADPPHGGSDCLGADPSLQDRTESALLVHALIGVSLSDTFQVVASYELEDAESDIEDLLVANHRLMGGISISL